MDIEKLKQQFEGDVSVSEADLEKYSYDASIFKIRPEVIVYPKTVQDIQHLVQYVSLEKLSHPEISLTPRSAGTDMGGGAINDSIIMDFTRYLNKIVELHDGKGSGQDIGAFPYAIAEPGVYYRDFEKATLEHNLLMPSYTASKSINAIGGMVANNSGGEKSLSYGKMENYVEELWVILADGKEYHITPLTELELEAKMKLQTFEGELYRKVYKLIRENYDVLQKAKPHVSKNSAGYYLWNVWDKKTFNLIKLLVGSQGTLGIFTKAKLKLVQPYHHSEMLVIFLNDLAPLGKVVNTVMQYHPETFESFDDHTFALAVKFLPGLLKKMKGNIIKLGWSFLPEMWMTLTGGLPKLLLMAEFTGTTEEEAVGRMKQAQAEVERVYGLKTHVTKNIHEEEKYWTVRRESFSLLREHVQNMHTAPFIDDIVVHPADLPEFLPRLDAIFKKYPTLIYTIAGHAGDANFHIIPLMDFTRADQRAIIPKLSDEVYDLVLEYKGSITAEHNDGLVRGPYLEKMYGKEVFGLFKKIKHIFDPLNIFNPHKKTDATEEYLVEHIRKD
jgi:FAD/FMN-containing dehydrogenase